MLYYEHFARMDMAEDNGQEKIMEYIFSKKNPSKTIHFELKQPPQIKVVIQSIC